VKDTRSFLRLLLFGGQVGACFPSPILWTRSTWLQRFEVVPHRLSCAGQSLHSALPVSSFFRKCFHISDDFLLLLDGLGEDMLTGENGKLRLVFYTWSKLSYELISVLVLLPNWIGFSKSFFIFTAGCKKKYHTPTSTRGRGQVVQLPIDVFTLSAHALRGQVTSHILLTTCCHHFSSIMVGFEDPSLTSAIIY
jgi:hypothetical protein